MLHKQDVFHDWRDARVPPGDGWMVYNERRSHARGDFFNRNTGVQMKVLKRLSIFCIFLIALSLVFNKANAENQGNSYLVPRRLIQNPCSYDFEVRTYSTPDGVGCVGPSELNGLANGNVAFINIPVPKIVKKVPELSIVGVPSFFLVTWDQASFAYADSAIVPYYEWIENGVRNRLINVRVQMRVKPAVVQSSEYELIMGNVGVEIGDQTQLVIDNEYAKSRSSASSKFEESCIAGYGVGQNSLLLIPKAWGGWQPDGVDEESRKLDVCNEFQKTLLTSASAEDIPHDDRYANWSQEYVMVNPSIIGTVSESASIDGIGFENGSPAFRIRIVTHASVEARVIWDRHDKLEERKEKMWDCSWDYYNDYEEIEWERWPEPIFCKYIYKIKKDWVPLCKPSMGTCGEKYGLKDSDFWWMPVAEGQYVIQADTVLVPVGSGYRYSDQYDIVVIQAQPLLVVP
jgi:hypothetical protein